MKPRGDFGQEGVEWHPREAGRGSGTGQPLTPILSLEIPWTCGYCVRDGADLYPCLSSGHANVHSHLPIT